MKIRAIITGSTGMVGKGVLLECLESPLVESVLVVNRKSVKIEHAKLKEIVHDDFFDLSEIESELTGYDTCFFCLGVSSVGLPDETYYRLTYDLTMNFAKTLLALNHELTFCYVSGAGTDSSEKGRRTWARVKGKTENALMALPFKAAYMFRPAFIQPLKGIKSKTKSYNAFYAVLKPLYPFLKVFPRFITNTEQLGCAMIKAAANGSDNSVLESVDINRT